jgi:hypothetical protein
MKMEEKMKKLMAENRKLKAMMKGPKRMAGGGKTSKYKAAGGGKTSKYRMKGGGKTSKYMARGGRAK